MSSAGGIEPIDEYKKVTGKKWKANEVITNLPNKFIPREYQQRLFDYILKPHLEYSELQRDGGEDFNLPPPSWELKAVQVLHRRAGKDIGAMHLIAIASQLRVGSYKHILPFQTQARQSIWEGMDGSGNRFIHTAFPKEIVESINESRMVVRFTNGSIYQLQGGDSDRLVGAGAVGIVYSESALMSSSVRSYLRPMLDETGGWELHITTPRGKNWFHKLAQHANLSDDWFYEMLNIDDTWRWAYFAEDKKLDADVVYDQLDGELKYKNPSTAMQAIKNGKVKAMYKVRVMNHAQMNALIAEGQDEFTVKQEYLCDWDVALMGSYYGIQVMDMIKTERIGSFAHNTRKPVFVHMDIGFNDLTSITFTQEGGNQQPITINHMQGSGKSLLEWTYLVEETANNLGYRIALICLPHDANQTEVSSGLTRLEYILEEGGFERRGLVFEVLERAPKNEGVEAVRGILATACIDESKCEFLVESLKSFRRRFDDKTQTYSNIPVHDWASHGADNYRYLASSWTTCLLYTSYEHSTARGNRMVARLTVKKSH